MFEVRSTLCVHKGQCVENTVRRSIWPMHAYWLLSGVRCRCIEILFCCPVWFSDYTRQAAALNCPWIMRGNERIDIYPVTTGMIPNYTGHLPGELTVLSGMQMRTATQVTNYKHTDGMWARRANNYNRLGMFHWETYYSPIQISLQWLLFKWVVI